MRLYKNNFSEATVAHNHYPKATRCGAGTSLMKSHLFNICLTCLTHGIEPRLR